MIFDAERVYLLNGTIERAMLIYHHPSRSQLQPSILLPHNSLGSPSLIHTYSSTLQVVKTMKLFHALGLSSSKARERDNLIESSLATSSILSRRLIEWSRSNSRGRLTAMRFHQEWRHEDCHVMGWYQQQRASSTTFRITEHRRDVHGPFYHEYLLLRLTDGAMCRIERIGQGSRADAIRSIGCESQDLIQWFPSEKYDSATTASKLIAEVDLGREFDILDVLAICYAIQNTKPCSVYTLQRYNCYFLCLTILCILSRRVASWETALTTNIWDSCVSAMLADLSSLSPEEANKHIFLRRWTPNGPTILQPDSLKITALRRTLVGNSRCLEVYNRTMSQTLWCTSWESTLSNGLQRVLHLVAVSMLSDEQWLGPGYKQDFTQSESRVASAISADKMLTRHYVTARRKATSLGLDFALSEYEAIRCTREPDHPATLCVRALKTLAPPVLAFVFALGPLSLLSRDKRNNPLDRLNSLAVRKLGFADRTAWFNMLISSKFEGGDDSKSLYAELDKRVNDMVNGLFQVSAILDMLATDKRVIQADLCFLLSCSMNPKALVTMLRPLVAPILAGKLMLAVEKKQPHLSVKLVPESGCTPSERFFGLKEFQELYLSPRIVAHADRVERHQLAAAAMVCQDIRRTMGQVWKSLPAGFGCIRKV